MKKQLMFYLMFLTCFILVIPIKVAQGETNNLSKIDLLVSPDGSLYDVASMKPGDWAPRTIAIKNNGEFPFEYEMIIRNNGQDKLFNELLLEISRKNETIYNGLLAEFTGLPPRELIPLGQEKLDITIRFPEHLGNDYQSLVADFSFIFTAEDESERAEAFVSGMVGSDGPKLPSTSTTIFTFILVGGLLLATGWSVKTYKRVRKRVTV